MRGSARVASPYPLFVDDDVILERHLIRRMLETIERECCGFVGCVRVEDYEQRHKHRRRVIDRVKRRLSRVR